MKAIILAAGNAKRMHSHINKVLHEICGKPLLLHVTDACAEAGIDDVTVVIGRDGDAVRDVLPASVHCVVQDAPQDAGGYTPHGTGYAVKVARNYIRPDEDVLVLYGDTPLITAEFLRKLTAYQRQNKADAVVTSVVMPDPFGYGRVYADDNNVFIKIVEQTDLTEAEAADPGLNTINTGICMFKGDALLYGLDRITNDNRQHEYYLTDVPAVLQQAGRGVIVYRAKEDPSVFMGVNTQAQLAETARHMRARINRAHMLNGVRMLDPATVYIDSGVTLAPEVTLYPGVVLEGRCAIESGAVIGPNTRMTNTTVAEGATIQYSVLADASVGAYASVGPFAYLRPGAVVGEHCKIGDFVEVKNATIGAHSKASHLTYIGDADIGSHVNVGCGVITANYDGKDKHRTTVRDHVFIGSNSNLVAPVEVGENAFIAAGSTITENVPPDTLAIARGRQVSKPGWRK